MAAKAPIEKGSTHPASLLPLATAENIRVLHLDPGMPSSMITGSLHLVDLADPNHAPYEAISYTWGPEPTPECPTVPIMIGGLKVFIRQNLHKALIRLRNPNYVATLWNDFLCITQDDLDEKAAQVAMIGAVFGQAERVRVSVGEHEHGSEMLFRGWPEELKPTTDERVTSLGFNRRAPNRCQLTADQKKRSEIWKRFFERKYWGRTWIVQEIYQAKELIIHCGDDQMSWDELITDRFQGDHYFDGISLTGVSVGLDTPQLTPDMISRISELDGNRRRRDDAEDLFEEKHILYFTQHFFKSSCAVAHDKIYAFLSMEGAQYRKQPLSINYKTPLPELLVSVYENRLVKYEEELQLANWNKMLPEADVIIESLKLDRKQRTKVVRLFADRTVATLDQNLKLRWRNIYFGFRYAVAELEDNERNVDKLTEEDYGAKVEWDREELIDDNKAYESFIDRFLSTDEQSP